MYYCLCVQSKPAQSVDDFQREIRSTVEGYKLIDPEEYKLVCDAVKMRRAMILDPKYATIEGTDQRALYEISETLHAMFVATLTLESLTWLKSKEGGRWFARTFKEFALPAHI